MRHSRHLRLILTLLAVLTYAGLQYARHGAISVGGHTLLGPRTATAAPVPGGDAYSGAPASIQAQPPAGACHYRHTNAGQPLPDPACTPGAVNTAVTQANLAATICARGWTGTVRPSETITGIEKRANAASYGYRGPLGQAEYDHLISLELGGSVNSAANLWVEPPSPGHQSSQGFTNPKDTVEGSLNHLVCNAVHLAADGRGSATMYLPLAAAQHLIATNWTTALANAPRYEVQP